MIDKDIYINSLKHFAIQNDKKYFKSNLLNLLNSIYKEKNVIF